MGAVSLQAKRSAESNGFRGLLARGGPRPVVTMATPQTYSKVATPVIIICTCSERRKGKAHITPRRLVATYHPLSVVRIVGMD